MKIENGMEQDVLEKNSEVGVVLIGNKNSLGKVLALEIDKCGKLLNLIWSIRYGLVSFFMFLLIV